MKRKRKVISSISFFVNNCKKILLFDKGIKSIRSFFVNKLLKGKFLQREKNVTLPFRNTVWNNPLHSPILNYILYQFNILHDFSFLFTSFFPSLSKSNLIRIGNRRGAITIGRDVISCSARLGSTRLDSARFGSIEQRRITFKWAVRNCRRPPLGKSSFLRYRLDCQSNFPRFFFAVFTLLSAVFFFLFFSSSFRFIEQFSVSISPIVLFSSSS